MKRIKRIKTYSMKRLFPDDEGALNGRVFKRSDARLSVPPCNNPQLSWIRTKRQTLVDGLLAEERPRPMSMWLTVLVILLHVLVAQRLLKPAEPPEKLTPPQPMMMEIIQTSATAPQQSETITKPEAAPKPPPPKKTPSKPLKKPKPVVKKATEIVPNNLKVTRKTVAKPVESKQEESVVETTPTPPAPVKAVAPKTATAPKKAEVFTEATVGANYGFNPKPRYPSIARREHWEGRVTLRIQVSADGSVDGVSVQRSSGHEELDDAALAAVKKWRFMPAKRGSTSVSSSVLVPIDFNLNN